MATLRFSTTVITWRGPSPFFFAPIPADLAAELRSLAKSVSYGWGMIPVKAILNSVTFTTALFPRDDSHLPPLKAAVRRQPSVTAGDVAGVELAVHGLVSETDR